MQVTAQRSPVASAFVFLITFSVVYSLSYFAIGMVLLISAATATIAYFRRNAAGAVLAAFFLLPMYWVFGGYPQTGTVPLLEFLSLALLTITLILAGTDWLAGLVGIWLGLLLAVPSWTILIIPAIASLALLRGRGPAILATSIFCFFGVFYLFAIQWGYLELAAPLQGGSTFFPALGALSANPMFANLFGSLLGPSWATNLSGSWVGQLFTYIPLYFVLIATVLVLAINYSLRLTRHMPFHLLASVVIASVMAGIAGLFVTGDTTNLVGAGVLTFNIAVLSVGGAPLLGPRPRFTTTGLAQLIAPPAVVEAQDFERKEGMQGIIVQDKPTPKTADYWEKAKGMDELKEELIRSVALPGCRRSLE